jgi:hypothetical protein
VKETKILAGGFSPLTNAAPCVTDENATIIVTLNGSDDDVDAVAAKLKAKPSEIKALAQAEEFTKFIVQSSNYNIHSNNFNRADIYGGENRRQGQYRYSGNVNLSVQPSEKALHFMKVLRANITISSYNGGNCQH